VITRAAPPSAAWRPSAARIPPNPLLAAQRIIDVAGGGDAQLQQARIEAGQIDTHQLRQRR